MEICHAVFIALTCGKWEGLGNADWSPSLSILCLLFFPYSFYLFFHNIPQLLFSVFPFFSYTTSSSLFSSMYTALAKFYCSWQSHLHFSHSWISLGYGFLCLHSHIRERHFGRSHTVPSWPLCRRAVKTSVFFFFLLFLQVCFWIIPDRHVGVLQGPGQGQVLLPKNLMDTWGSEVSSQPSQVPK